jgi:hypothetical protein
LNDDAFETVVSGARLLARSPGVRAAWRIARPNFGGRFLDFMDGVVAGSAVQPPVDLSLEAWKIAFASEASRPPTEQQRVDERKGGHAIGATLT